MVSYIFNRVATPWDNTEGDIVHLQFLALASDVFTSDL